MRQYIVDAFADRVFEGNPAAVCVLDRWPEEDRMMRITRENNLSETAFAVPEGEGYRRRWFTPSGEIDLCGHATLAAAFVITEFISPGLDVVLFDTLSGRLTVRKRGELLEMDFPAYQLKRLEVTDQITEALGARPSEVWRARDLLCVFEDPETVIRLEPDQEKLKCHGPSPPKWGCQRTRCAALATATSSPTGLPGRDGGSLPPARRLREAEPSTAARRGTGLSWPAGQLSMPGVN